MATEEETKETGFINYVKAYFKSEAKAEDEEEKKQVSGKVGNRYFFLSRGKSGLYKKDTREILEVFYYIKNYGKCNRKHTCLIIKLRLKIAV